MESQKIFEESNKELSRVLKSTSTDNIRIDLSKLDSRTKGMITDSLRSTIIQRKKEIENVIFGIQE